MLDPTELLAASRLLAGQAGQAPSEAELRRAISTAYYAVFHAVLQMAADRFVGRSERASAGYALIYRGFQHGQMKRICGDIDRHLLSERYRNGLKKTTAAPALRTFSGNFGILQDQRQKADYDSQSAFKQSDAIDACDLAELTIQSLDAIPEPDRTDFLALLLVNLHG